MKKNFNEVVSKAIALFDAGNSNEAINKILHLCKKNPRSKKLKMLFIQMACRAGSNLLAKPNFIKELVICFDEKVDDSSKLLLLAGIALNQDLEFIHGITLLNMEKTNSDGQVLANRQLRAVFRNNLLHCMLSSALLTNREYDLAMTQIRRCLLIAVSADKRKFDLDKDVGKKFCTSLALQCLINEHVYYCRNDEHLLVKKLQVEVEAGLKSDNKVDTRIEDILLIIAMYQPLFELNIESERWKLSSTDWTRAMKPLIREVNVHYEEMYIREKIDTLTPIDNEISVIVRKHYEVNPYPRWVSFPRYEKSNFAQWVTDRFPHFEPPGFLQSPINVLSAGCGTGAEVLSAAASWNTSRILAIDLSKTSLAYAIHKAEELGFVDRIDFKQADILRLHTLPELYQKFHVITSRGVLVTMKDPIAGFRILHDLLCPGGIMRIALYSETARRHVVKARKYIADNRLDATPETIRRFRHEVLLSQHPELNALLKFSDMFSLSPCRDLLFHAQETRHNIGEIKHLLNKFQLKFIGFEGIEQSKQIYRHTFPDDSSMTNLDNWGTFEEKYPDTFTEMYGVIAQKM